MDGEDLILPSEEQMLQLLANLSTTVQVTASCADPLLSKIRNSDPSLELSSGMSLLLVRPQLLLSSLHHLVILLALRLSSVTPIAPDASSWSALASPFDVTSRDTRKLNGTGRVASELAGEVALSHEIMDKVRGLESKLDYQIKKLVGLAEAEEARGRESIEDIGEDPLSFRPNPSAMISSSVGQTSRPRRDRDADEASDAGVTPSRSAVYKPPRISAMPYNEPGSKTRRTERRAPALLSEFATTMDGTPLLESTSGLSTRPVQADRHTNSTSAKRAAELERINRFEEENMMRLVTSKREGKRRRDDEAALAMGYGVGGPARSRGRKQNGLEAELEGVLGDRRSKGLWEGVGGKLGKREGVLVRGESRGNAVVGSQPKKARFERDIHGRGKRGGQT